MENIILTVEHICTCVVEFHEQNTVSNASSYLLERLRTLVEQLRTVELIQWRDKVEQLREQSAPTSEPPDIHRTGKRGRPSFVVQEEQIRFLQEVGFSYTEMAAMLGISRMTLYRKRQEFDIEPFGR